MMLKSRKMLLLFMPLLDGNLVLGDGPALRLMEITMQNWGSQFLVKQWRLKMKWWWLKELSSPTRHLMLAFNRKSFYRTDPLCGSIFVSVFYSRIALHITISSTVSVIFIVYKTTFHELTIKNHFQGDTCRS